MVSTSTRLVRGMGLAALMLGTALLTESSASAAPLLFWSDQGTPVQEQQAIRDMVLPGFSGDVDFQPNDPGPYTTRIEAELKAGKGAIGVIGGLHGDFSAIPDGLIDLSDVPGMASGVKINATYLGLGKLGTNEQKYIPWMQATYVMAANKKALEYLPAGADINALTYDQLIAWAKNLAAKTGGPKFGLPAGPKGLIHRFVQGYLYPSFTDSMVTKFRSPEAAAMWEKVKELWKYTNPASTNYAFMQEQLLSDEVWVAWDHTARLADAFNQKPGDFVAFPAPAGPTGRGFMPVVAGLGIPTTSPDKDTAKKFIAYMLQPATQLNQLKANGFFPVVQVDMPSDMPPAVQTSGAAIAAQSGSADANPGLLPVGLGSLGGKFNQVYIDTFQRIVLSGQDIKSVLDEQAGSLKAIMDEAKAPCWAPDKPSEGACPVD
jgi:multiple sugar transport system substrate-binding protein